MKPFTDRILKQEHPHDASDFQSGRFATSENWHDGRGDMVKLYMGCRVMWRLTCQNMRFVKILASQNFRHAHNIIHHQTYLREEYHDNHSNIGGCCDFKFKEWSVGRLSDFRHCVV